MWYNLSWQVLKCTDRGDARHLGWHYFQDSGTWAQRFSPGSHCWGPNFEPVIKIKLNKFDLTALQLLLLLTFVIQWLFNLGCQHSCWLTDIFTDYLDSSSTSSIQSLLDKAEEKGQTYIMDVLSQLWVCRDEAQVTEAQRVICIL